jgi:hypothetical protein
MPWVGFELTISVFERAETFHALDPATIVIGCNEDKFSFNRCSLYLGFILCIIIIIIICGVGLSP